MKMNKEKIYAYAIAYLENKIQEHEQFIEKYTGDKSTLAQFQLVTRYKQELRELQYLANP